MELKANDIKKFEELNNVSLPRDDSSESGLIGTLLEHPEFILKSDYIMPKMFYDRCLGSIYCVIGELTRKGIDNIDTFIIFNAIEGNKGYKEPFVKSNVPDIVDHLENLKIVARNTLEEYEMLAEKVLSASFKRDGYIKLEVLKNDLVNSDKKVNDINYDLQKSISDFSKIYICNKEVKTLSEQVDAIWEGIISKRTSGFFGFPSKVEELNKYMTYEKTELSVISAPGKVGKTQFISNEAWHKTISGVPTAYIDREMSTENHMIRMLSHLTGIDNRRIKSGDLTFTEEKMVKEKLIFIKSLPYTHIYRPVAEMGEMYMTIKSMQLKYGTEFLIYDYVKANDGSDGDKEYQKLGKLTDWLKNDIAGSLNLSVLSACQMDDNGTKVADSQKILRNCSTLCFLTRKTKEEIVNDSSDAGNMKLRVKASRNGEVMFEDEYINLVMNGNTSTVNQAKIPFIQGGNTPY